MESGARDVKWFALALVYATLLTWPGHLLAPAYQALLLGLTGLVTGATLVPSSDGSVDLSASNVLTIFVALCLASGFAPWRLRLRAILLGLMFLVAVECATGVLGMGLARALSTTGAVRSAWSAVLEQLLELPRWLAVPLAWGVLLRPSRLAQAAAMQPPAQEVLEFRTHGRDAAQARKPFI